VEAEGIARARDAMRDSPLVIWVVDASRPLDADDLAIARGLANGGAPVPRRVVVALNKSDLDARVFAETVRAALPGCEPAVIEVSARTGAGVDALREGLAAALGADRPAGAAALANPRHAEALGRARETLARAARAADEGAPGEILALELRECLAAIGEVTGESVAEDLLDRIFSRFCVGK
jgi:tRNA modification GTPase